jgi:hypothetical protein
MPIAYLDLCGSASASSELNNRRAAHCFGNRPNFAVQYLRTERFVATMAAASQQSIADPSHLR